MPPRSIWLLSISLTGILLALAPLFFSQTEIVALKDIFIPKFDRVRSVLQATDLRAPFIQYNTSANMSTPKKMPVYFLSHGGPTIIEDYTHPAHAKLQEIGREITQRVKPKAIVVFSAHWQAGPDTIEVNTAAAHPLLYDYYGFPPHYYSFTFPHSGSPVLADRVLSLLHAAGIRARGVHRGLDHGVFAPFRVAFDPSDNPLGPEVPIVQVSLFDSDSGHAHLRLGEAVAALRDEGVLIVVSGMAVHNTRDHFRAKAAGWTGPRPYTEGFDEALRKAVETAPGEGRARAVEALLERADVRDAHPSFEHLLPIHIGVGAAGMDAGERFWTFPEGGLSWAQYRFGEIGA